MHPKESDKYSINDDEIIRRGAPACGGNEEFDFFKCPECHHIFLIEGEYGDVYFDPEDLTATDSISWGDTVNCFNCGKPFPGAPFAPEHFMKTAVTWHELESSSWSWVLTLRT